MAKYLITLLFLLLISGTSVVAQRRLPAIVGCYSDLHLDSDNALVTGTGSFEIKRYKNRYSAIFVELVGDGGSYLPAVHIPNLKVDEVKRIVFFDIVLHDGRDKKLLRNVSGRISAAGIKMNWRAQGTLIGSANPFLKRSKVCG